jgi:hypothetical protein
MNRRRILWLLAFAVLIAGVAVGWAIFRDRDPDFQAIGPKTSGIRANFAKLDSIVDAADYSDCATLYPVLGRLNLEFGNRDRPAINPWEKRQFVSLGKGIVPRDAPVQLPKESTRMTLKQFLRVTFRGFSDEEVAFIVRHNFIEVTTRKRLEEERARYLERTSLSERLNTAWNEWMGNVDENLSDRDHTAVYY